MCCQPVGKSKRFGSQGDRWRAGVWNSFLNSPKVGPKVYNTADSQVVTQPGTDAALQDLTSVIGRELVFFFLSKKALISFLFTVKKVTFLSCIC